MSALRRILEDRGAYPQVTKVMRPILSACLLLGLMPCVGEASAAAPQEAPATNSQAPGLPVKPSAAEDLYLQLRSVGLDKSRVYHARDVSFDRGAVHITLDDGSIGFTKDVAGRVTGAFFEGDGEVLLIPPNQVERASMMLFTGAAILEERFVTAYFRFDDDTFAELRPQLRLADNAEEFVTQWDQTAQNLASLDALRLLLSFSKFLPGENAPEGSEARDSGAAKNERMLHARVQGRRLGPFDLYFDSAATEQIRVGQLSAVEGESFYNVWTSFSLQTPEGPSSDAGNVTAEGDKTNAFHISSYTIRAEVRPPTELECDATLHLESLQGGDRTMQFELSRFLQIERVKANGQPVEFLHNPAVEGTQLARRGNDVVVVIFPRPLQKGQRIDLKFVYHGDVLSEMGGGLLYVGARGTWYPNRGPSASEFDLQFRYPAGWTLVATGKRSEPVPASAAGAHANAAPGEQIGRWVSEQPIPMAGFNLGKYSHAVAHAGNVNVDVYATTSVERGFPSAPNEAVVPALPGITHGQRQEPIVIEPPPPSPAQNERSVADQTAQAIEFFVRRFGPYPYPNLAVTQIPGVMSQGWPGLVFLTTFTFLTPGQQAALRLNSLERVHSNMVIAHEAAHQWWGDLITWSTYRDQWVVEGLAEYSSLMFLESHDPEKFHAMLEAYRDDLLRKNKDGTPLLDAGPVTLGIRLSSSRFPDGYVAISYGRGAWLFHMLRSMMHDAGTLAGRHPESEGSADEAFVRALHKLRDRYQGKSVSTQEVLQAFEEEMPASLRYEGHKSLDWFYTGWINGTAIPRLQLHGVKYVDHAGSTSITGTISQTEAPKDLVTPVPLYGVVKQKNVLLGQVFVDGEETEFRLTAPLGTRRLLLDPEQTLLARTR